MSRAHFPRNTIEQAYQRQQNRCAICGEDFEKLWTREAMLSQAHHILRVADGGSHDLSNCAILCEGCHNQADNYGNYRQPLELLRSEFAYLDGNS